MLGSFYNGLSGLRSNSEGLNVISNNLANVNAIGFKRSRADFAELVNAYSGLSDNGSPFQVGMGSTNTQILSLFNQGAILTGQSSNQLALVGDGFFQVKDGDQERYTRAGNFGFRRNEDLTSTLVNSQGAVVQGYLGTNSDGSVNTSGGVTDLTFDFAHQAPGSATSLIGFQTNLQADAAVGTTYQNTLEVYSADGTLIPLRITYTKSATENAWDYNFTVDGSDQASVGSGSLSFDSKGQLATVNGTAVAAVTNPSIRIDGLPGGSQTISWDLSEPSAFTSYAHPSSSSSIRQNGYPPSKLEQIDFAQDGTILGLYGNGQTLQLGRVAVATFTSMSGLAQTDGGMYRETSQSGEASFSTTNAGRASIVSQALESSNVDTATEFTDMILHQRGYQSSSKAITTSDQIMQEILGLKR